MKRLSSSTLRHILAIVLLAVLTVGASQTAGAAETKTQTTASAGRLIINRSPLLGRNVSLTINLDGRLAGTLGWRRTFDQSLAPGRHHLVAVPNRSGAAWQTTLDVRAGHTYSYTAHYNVDRLVLDRAR
jgi:hypothetical protein